MKLSKPERKKIALQALGAFIGGRRDIAARGFVAAATGEWEGHERSRFRFRPAVSLTSQDHSLDLGTREAMTSEARSLTQTFAICSHFMRIYGTYCVGSCRMKWNTGSPEIDRIYRKYWNDFMPMSDANGIHNFKKQTRIACNSAVRDGDMFGQKITDAGFGQVRLIESDRVSTNGTGVNVDEEVRDKNGKIISRVVGGIGINGQGLRTFARVWDRTRYGGFTNKRDIPFREMFHIFDTDRADAYRGVTKFHTVLNPSRDYKETKRAETIASKIHSRLALFIKNAVGGAGANTGVDLYANDSATQGGDNKVNVQEVNEGAIAYGYPEDEIKAHSNDRPSEGWRWLMEDLVREMALGMDLPFSVVYHMVGLGGPGTRFEINRAARTFLTFIEDVLEPKWLVPIAGWKIAEAIDDGEVPFHPNWGSVKPQRPVYITIDLGRDSKAGIEENRAALLTATSWFEELGLDFEEETELLFQEERFRQDMAAKHGVKKEDVRIINPNQPQQPEQQKSEPEPEPKKKAA